LLSTPGQHPDPQTGAVNVPIYLSSTFELNGIGSDRGWDYSRAGNPTRDRLEMAWPRLRAARAATHSPPAWPPSRLVAMLRAGDHIVCSSDVYAGTVRLFDQIVSGYASRSITSIQATLQTSKAAIKAQHQTGAH